MLDKNYYSGWNKNDEYGAKKDVLALLEELENFDKRVKKFFGPNKVKDAGEDARRSCRIMRAQLKSIIKKLQMTTHDYDGDYS